MNFKWYNCIFIAVTVNIRLGWQRLNTDRYTSFQYHRVNYNCKRLKSNSPLEYAMNFTWYTCIFITLTANFRLGRQQFNADRPTSFQSHRVKYNYKRLKCPLAQAILAYILLSLHILDQGDNNLMPIERQAFSAAGLITTEKGFVATVHRHSL